MEGHQSLRITYLSQLWFQSEIQVMLQKKERKKIRSKKQIITALNE